MMCRPLDSGGSGIKHQKSRLCCTSSQSVFEPLVDKTCSCASMTLSIWANEILRKSSSVEMSFVFKCDWALFFSSPVTCGLWQFVQGRSRRVPSRCLPSSAPWAVTVQLERWRASCLSLCFFPTPFHSWACWRNHQSARGQSVWGAVGCGFGAVRKHPSIVLPPHRSGGGRKKRRERNFGAAGALNLLLVKAWYQHGFSLYFVSTKRLG